MNISVNMVKPSSSPSFICVNKKREREESRVVNRLDRLDKPNGDSEQTELSSPCWQTSSRGVYSPGVVGLHQEIEDFYQWLAPSQESHHARLAVVSRVQDIVVKVWPAAKLETFGSFRTGLYLPSSDLDLVLFGRWEAVPFRSLERELMSSDVVEPGSLIVLDSTRIPIIKFTDRATKIKVDISFNLVSGIQAVQVVNMFKKKFPMLPHLVTLLKHFLLTRDLASVFTGGLSSYSITLMVVSFFQLHGRRDATSSEANLGVLLLEFLQLYGQTFNYSEVGISVRQGGRYLGKEGLGSSSVGGLAIEDPLQPDNNVAGGSYRMAEVVKSFSKAYQVLAVEVNKQLSQSGSYLRHVFKES